jgi:hypothetical protein
MRTPGTEGHGELVESLKQFLNVQSVAPSKTVHCGDCGSVLRYLPTQFWLEGGEQGWNIFPALLSAVPASPVTPETFIS